MKIQINTGKPAFVTAELSIPDYHGDQYPLSVLKEILSRAVTTALMDIVYPELLDGMMEINAKAHNEKAALLRRSINRDKNKKRATR